MIKILLVIATGVFAGVLAGLFGVGGGVILVPALVLILGYSQTAASGTSLVALLLPVGIFGVLKYYNSGKINMEHIRYGFIAAIGMFIGAYFGASIAAQFSDVVLKKVFSVFLVLVALRFWFY